MYRRKIIKLRVLKGGRRYIWKIKKRLNGYKFRFIRTRKPSIKRKIVSSVARIRLAKRYLSNASVRRQIQRATKRTCIKRKSVKSILKPAVA